MVTPKPISLSGGAEARARFMVPVSTVAPLRAASPALSAFLRLTEALGDAAEAEALRQDLGSWDPAYAHADAEAEAAFALAVKAAHAAAAAAVHYRSDRMLPLFARFIATALGMESDADRGALAATLVTNAEAFRSTLPGPIGRQAEALVQRACTRMARLSDLMGPVPADKVDVPALPALETLEAAAF